MSLNKGKAKAKPKMAIGGNTKKPAVMDRREYDVAISGKTMPTGMYKKGGSTKTKKFAALAPPYDKVTFADKIAGAKKGSKKKK